MNYEEFYSLAKSRRSVRSFKSEMPPKEIIDDIVAAGVCAPSGMNRQPVIVIAVTDRQMRDKLSKMNAAVMGADKDPFYGAPAVLVVLADKSVPTHVYDGSLVMGQLLLAAHAHGLGSCWIHRAKEEFESPEGKEILASLGIKGDYEGIGHCVLGYTDGDAPAAREINPGRVYHI